MGEEAKVIVLESLLKKHKREEEWALASKELLNFEKKRAENKKQLNIYDIDGSPFLNHHFDDFYIPLARLYSADTTSICGHSNVCSFCKLPIVGINVRPMWNSVGFYQIAKLSMIPVSCFLEIVLDKVRYSRDTKLSIVLVLLGVGVCTVTDVNVNAKGFCCCMEYFSATILCTSSTTQVFHRRFLQPIGSYSSSAGRFIYIMSRFTESYYAFHCPYAY